MREKIKLVSSAGTGHFYTTDKNKTKTPDNVASTKDIHTVTQHVAHTEAQIASWRA
mgnify:CR=1 FL=1